MWIGVTPAQTKSWRRCCEVSGASPSWTGPRALSSLCARVWSWGRGQQLNQHNSLCLAASAQRARGLLFLLVPTWPKNELVRNLLSFHVQMSGVSDACACAALNHHQDTALQAQSDSLEGYFSSSVYKAEPRTAQPQSLPPLLGTNSLALIPGLAASSARRAAHPALTCTPA